MLLAERVDPARGTVLREWLDHSVTAAFAERMLVVDEAVARRAAGLACTRPGTIS